MPLRTIQWPQTGQIMDPVTGELGREPDPPMIVDTDTGCCCMSAQFPRLLCTCGAKDKKRAEAKTGARLSGGT